jgi:hypothetical protein
MLPGWHDNIGPLQLMHEEDDMCDKVDLIFMLQERQLS